MPPFVTSNYEQQLFQIGQEVLKSYIPQIVSIWNHLGQNLCYPEREQNRLQAIQSQLEGLMESLLQEEKAYENRVSHTVDCARQHHKALCDELGYPAPTQLGKSLPLFKQQTLFFEANESLTTEKEERLEVLELLVAREQHLCRQLGMDLNTPDRILTHKHLLQLQRKIKDLENAITLRESEYEKLRDSIWDTMQQLGLSISTPFEVNIFVNKPSDVILSEDLLFDLKEYHSKLISRLEINSNSPKTIPNLKRECPTPMNPAKKRKN